MTAAVCAQEPSFTDEGSWRVLQARIGGVVVTLAQISEALESLQATAYPMMKRTLQQINSPLADCDYHTVAAPYRERFLAAPSTGRGAQGRHLTKLAFCFALAAVLNSITLDPMQGFLPLLDDAYTAISSDYTYSAAIARSAVAIKTKKHRRAAA